MFELGSFRGNWEVLTEPFMLEGRKVYYCMCKCGDCHHVREEVLKKGDSKFCRGCRFASVAIKIGDIFGKWTVIQEVKTEEKRKTYIVKCECGFVRTLRGIRLRFGDSLACRTCGSTKHDMAHSKTYTTWESMIQRCTNPKNTNYKHYGKRGIRVCEAWLVFDSFLADMGERPEGKELDRIDNDGNYEKTNCRWVTHQENLKNRNRS
jgi:protein-arginine kinase activator protein McsA